jgi:LssY C-terminus
VGVSLAWLALALVATTGALACAPAPRPSPAPQSSERVATAHDSVTYPAGTKIPVRLLQSIQSGRDHAGTVIYAQTLGALARDSCVILPPFLAVRGRVTQSHRGGWFGRRSELALRFDSLEIAAGAFAAMDAIADSLEYLPYTALGDSGQIYGGRAHAARVSAAALAGRGLAIVGMAVIPVDLLEGYLLFRRPAPVRLLAGEVGRLRLLAPVALEAPPSCQPIATHPDLAPIPLPEFVPRTTNRAGTSLGDPINFVFLGTLTELDTAFARAGWDGAHAHTRGAVLKEVEAAIRSRRGAVSAPVSTEYFEGRPEDAAYELLGPNAKMRHHIRVWQLDDAPGVLVASANHDIGLSFDPLRGRATHRVDPEIDRERDYITTQLEAGGCADLLEFVTLPGAVTQARTASGQQLITDGRSAVVRTRACHR